MKRIAIINGPNLNLVGRREPNIYGNEPLDIYLQQLAQRVSGEVELTVFQSNHEGDIIDEIQRVGFNVDGIIINAAAYTHTSVAIADALRAVDAPAVEVHISDVRKREPYRQVSMIKDACVAVISGLGLKVYDHALDYLLQ